MNKQKIIIFIDWYIPAYKAGGPVKSVYNIVQQFCVDVDFYIVTSNKDFCATQPLEGVVANEWATVSNAKVIYLDDANQTVERYSEIMEEIKPTKIYFNSLFSKNFTLKPLKIAKKKGYANNIVLAPRGMLGAGALQIKSLKKKLFIRYAKLTSLFKGITWHASTPDEAEEINLNFGSHSKVMVAENLGAVVGSNYEQRTAKQKQGKLKLLFVSRISTKKNLLFALESIALTKNKENISISIVGPAEDLAYTQLCQDYIDKTKIDAVFEGSKNPIQLAEMYATHDLFVLPTQHENYGHVIIESLSKGTPILISKNTPWKDLETRGVGFDLELDTPLFASKLDYFFDMTDEVWRTYSKKSFEFAKSQVNNQKAIQDNYAIFVTE